MYIYKTLEDYTLYITIIYNIIYKTLERSIEYVSENKEIFLPLISILYIINYRLNDENIRNGYTYKKKTNKLKL